MTATAFDTLKAAKALKDAGFDEAQAEAVVATVDEVVREHTAPLASGHRNNFGPDGHQGVRFDAREERVATKDDVANATRNMATKEVRRERNETLSERNETWPPRSGHKEDVATIRAGNMARKMSRTKEPPRKMSQGRCRDTCETHGDQGVRRC